MKKIPQLDRLPGFSSWLEVVKAYGRCQQLLTRELAEEGVSIAQHELLLSIRRDEGLSQKTLARRLFVTKSNVTGHLERLEVVGLVRRAANERDGRSRDVFLTPEGRRLLSRTLRRHARVVKLMTEGLGPKDQEALVRIMRTVRNILEAELSGDEPPATATPEPRSP